MKQLLWLIPLLFFSACEEKKPKKAHFSEENSKPHITFNQSIELIFHEKCHSCHCTSRSVAFSELSFEQVKSHAVALLLKIEANSMPPWLPDETGAKFQDGHRLKKEEIDLIRKWITNEMPEGDHPTETKSNPPTQPIENPDLILELGENDILPSGDELVRREYTLEMPPSEMAIRKLQFRPNSQGAIQHASIFLTQKSENSSDNDPSLTPPGGKIWSWTPARESDSFPFTSAENQIFLLRLTLKAGEEPVQIAPKLELFSAPDAPLSLSWSVKIDGEFTLPAEAKLTTLYPDPSSDCRSIHLKAELPDGTQKTLLNIPQWNPQWHEAYPLEAPLPLPAGTKLTSKGGQVWSELLAGSAESRRSLADSDFQKRIATDPDSPAPLLAYADFLRDQEDHSSSVEQYQRALNLVPQDVSTHYKLGLAQASSNNLTAATQSMQKAVRLDPELTAGWLQLAHLATMEQNYRTAIIFYRRVLEQDPDHEIAKRNLFQLRGALGN